MKTISLNSRGAATDAPRRLPILPADSAGDEPWASIGLTTGPVEIRRREHGYCVEGPGFYVWDEDPREVSRVARDLARRVGCELPAPLLPAITPPRER